MIQIPSPTATRISDKYISHTTIIFSAHILLPKSLTTAIMFHNKFWNDHQIPRLWLTITMLNLRNGKIQTSRRLYNIISICHVKMFRLKTTAKTIMMRIIYGDGGNEAREDVPLCEEAILSHLKTRRCKERERGGEAACGVCLEDLYREDVIEIAMLHCRHEFHFPCINQWLQQKNQCPLCRAKAVQLRSLRKMLTWAACLFFLQVRAELVKLGNCKLLECFFFLVLYKVD